MQKLIYLATPYSSKKEDKQEKLAEQQARYEKACEIAARLMNKGYFVFSPIAHCHPIAVKYGLPTDWAYWKGYIEVMLPRCDEIFVAEEMQGWDESTGILAEIQMASEQSKAVRFVEKE